MRSVSYLAIDLGGRRIGLAVSDSGVLATPHSVISNEGNVVEKLATLGRELETETFVVGIPRRARTDAGEGKYRDFADQLRQRTCKQVVLWDETLSTVEAAERLRAAGRRGRDAKRDIDMHAAAVILQSYLDSLAGRPS
jgi:putative holliday junction resolvase